MNSKNDMKTNLLNSGQSNVSLQAASAITETVQLTRDLHEIRKEICFMKFLYFLSGLTSSTWGRFGAIYYMEKGLTAQQIGLIEGIMPSVKAVSTMFWGYISDITKTKKGVYFFCRVAGTASLTLLAFNFFSSSFIRILAVSLGSQAFTSGGVLDAWTFDMLGEHAKTEYGKIRLWMAVSWGLGAFGMSWITDYLGFNYNFILYDTLAALSVFLMVVFIPAKTPVEKAMGDDKPDRKEACKAVCNIPVVVFLAEMLIMGIGIGVVEKLLFIYLKNDLGASTVLCGTSVLMTVSMELPIFYAMDWLNRKLGYNILMMISQISYIVRVYAYTLLQKDTKNWIVLIEVLHGLTFGFLWIGAKEYQRLITPMGWQGTFSSLLWMVYGSIGMGLGAIVGGYCFDEIGARDTYKGSGALVGLLFLVRVITTLTSWFCKCGRFESGEN